MIYYAANDDQDSCFRIFALPEIPFLKVPVLIPRFGMRVNSIALIENLCHYEGPQSKMGIPTYRFVGCGMKEKLKMVPVVDTRV
jgi:hypothetical protein